MRANSLRVAQFIGHYVFEDDVEPAAAQATAKSRPRCASYDGYVRADALASVAAHHRMKQDAMKGHGFVRGNYAGMTILSSCELLFAMEFRTVCSWLGLRM